MKRFAVAAGLLVIAVSSVFLLTAQPQAAASKDIVLEAMRAEMQRARGLRGAGGMDVPYFFEYSLDDVRGYSVTATLGGVLSERQTRLRVPRVQVRVGDYEFDNSNYVLSDAGFGPRFDFGQMPEDNNLLAMRHQLWLSTDRAFKNALEAIGRKRAALRAQNLQQEKLADFAKAEPVKMLLDVTPRKIEEAAWRKRAVDVSAVFANYPRVLLSGVDFEFGENATYLLNSEGTEVRYPDNLNYLRIRASGQAADGMTVRDHAVIHSTDPSRLGSDAELKAVAETVAKNVTALAEAPVGEAYSGPVLFEAQAAAQLFAEVLGSQLAITRRPVPEASRPVPFVPSDLEGRLNARILPTGFTVTDDPTQKTFEGRELMGHYDVDMEGVRPKPLTLIEGGNLKAYLSTRQPNRFSTESNGRARIPGNFGHKMAGITNLFVKSNDGVPAAELKTRLLAMIKDRGKPYGIIVRKMDFPSSATPDDLRRLAAALAGGGAGHVTSSPLLVYRVNPDGSEQLVRGLRLRGFSVRSFRDITASSTELAQFDFMGNGAAFSLMGAGGYVYMASSIAPALLFEDLELDKPQMDFPRLPVVPAPALTK